jgi:hypothetical protein
MILRSPWVDKTRWFLFFSIAYGFFYVLPNLRPLYLPFVLPLTSFEKNTPLIPWTILVYTSDYFLVGSVALLLTDPETFQRFARRAMLILFASGIFFWLLPTQYLRPSLPNPSNLAEHLLKWVWFIDAPTNCFPSLHVGFTTLAVGSIWPKLRFFYGVWALAVFASVVTTKQHYLWDIAGGVLIAWLCSALDARLEKKRNAFLES